MAAATVAAWALLLAPAIFGDGQFLYRDAGRMHHPVKRWLAEELRRGHLPEWNPYAGMGLPVVATGVDAPLHPLNALLALLPFEAAFKAWVLLSVLGAGIGAAAWARSLGRSTAGAATAGLAFMLSGVVVSSTDNLQYLTSVAAAPWFFASAHVAASRAGALPLVGVAVASFVTAAGGDPVGWAVAVALAVALPILLDDGRRRRRLLRGLAAAAVAVLGAAPVILPIAAWLPHSSRAVALAAEEHARWNLHPLRLVELAVPHLVRSTEPGSLYADVFHAYAGNAETTIPWAISIYAGSGVLALAAFAALRDRGGRRLAVVAAVLAWMALGPYGGFGQLARHLPVLSGIRYWEKFVVWVALAAAAAAATGVDRLFKAREGRGLAAVAGGGAIALGACWAIASAAPAMLARQVEVGNARPLAEALVANVREGTGSAAASLALLALAAALITRGRLARLGPTAVVAIVALDLGAANARAYVLSSPRLVTEPSPIPERLRAAAGLPRVVTPFRIPERRWPELTQCEGGWRWLARTAGAAANVGGRVANFEPYTGMLPARLARFGERAQPATVAPLAALWGFGDVVVPGSPALAKEAGLSGPVVILASDPALPAYLLRQPARPRVALAGALEAVVEARALEFALSSGAAGSGLTVVEGAIPEGYAPPAGAARLVADGGERLVVDAEADRRALVVVNDEWVPGWTAEVDGRPEQILAANYRARGIWIPAGRHTVELRYRTPLLREGILVAAGTVLALVTAWFLERRRRRAAS